MSDPKTAAPKPDYELTVTVVDWTPVSFMGPHDQCDIVGRLLAGTQVFAMLPNDTWACVGIIRSVEASSTP